MSPPSAGKRTGGRGRRGAQGGRRRKAAFKPPSGKHLRRGTTARPRARWFPWSRRFLDQFRAFTQFEAIAGKTWNHSVVVGDVVLVRNSEAMAAFRLPAAAR